MEKCQADQQSNFYINFPIEKVGSFCKFEPRTHNKEYLVTSINHIHNEYHLVAVIGPVSHLPTISVHVMNLMLEF